MDGFTLIARLVEAFVWPTTVLIGLVVLRQPLGLLLGQLTKLKYKGLEAEFGAEVLEIRTEAESELEPPSPERDTDPEESSAQRLLHSYPSAAVMEAWRGVELAAKELLKRNGVEPSGNTATPYRHIERTLASTEALAPGKVKIFGDLRRLRNKVVHAEGFEISSERASEYVRLALMLTSHLNNLES